MTTISANPYVEHDRMIDVLDGTTPLEQVIVLNLLYRVRIAGRVVHAKVVSLPMYGWAYREGLLHVYPVGSGETYVSLTDRGNQLYLEMTNPIYLIRLYSI